LYRIEMTGLLQPRQNVRRAVVVFVYVLLAAATLGWWWWNGRPVQITDVAGGRVQCLSYSPPSMDPMGGRPVLSAQIRSDLRQLAKYTNCVRTYSVNNGLDQVPQIARELGLKVILGAWIGIDNRHNDWELARALALTHTHADVIQAVVVGNEVLLRREQTPAQLREYLRRARAATDVPVTYADVWEFWLANPEVAQDVAFVTVHILPYWEDRPVAIDEAVPHVARVLEEVQRAFPQRRILIGEVGWPSTGRQRQGAVPSRVNQARFFREFTAYAATHDVQYNFIEAFDQPWKRRFEGTVGGAWGLFDAYGRLKFPLTGPVENEPRWRWPVLAAFVAASAALALAAWRWRGARAWVPIVVAALAAYSGAAVFFLQCQELLTANRNWREWVGSSTWFASGWVVYFCCTLLIVRALRAQVHVQPVPSAARVFRRLAPRWKVGQRSRSMLALARMVLLFGASYVGLLLTIDPRYRDFPVSAIVLPTIALWLHALIEADRSRAERPCEEILLAYWLVIASVWVAVAEGFRNLQALTWCALSLWMALTVMWGDWWARRGERTQQQAERGELDPI
jgi:glucan 1,3-beta-glucosidase